MRVQPEWSWQPPVFCPSPSRCRGNSQQIVHFRSCDDFVIVSDRAGNTYVFGSGRTNFRFAKFVQVGFLSRLCNGMNISRHFKQHSTGAVGVSHAGKIIIFPADLIVAVPRPPFQRRGILFINLANALPLGVRELTLAVEGAKELNHV